MADSFTKAFKGVDQAIKRGTASALNKALAQTKTQVVRKLREDTGLKTDVITSRTRFKKAKTSDLSVILGLAIKFGIALSKFSPSLKNIRKVPKNGKKARTYKGVTVSIGQAGRQLAPGIFALDNSTGLIPVARKGSLDSSGAYVDPSAPSHPLTTPKSDVFTESAKALQEPSKQFLTSKFSDVVGHEIDFAIAQQFNLNK